MKTWEGFVFKLMSLAVSAYILYVFYASGFGAAQYVRKYHEVIGRIDKLEADFERKFDGIDVRLKRSNANAKRKYILF